MQPLLIAKIGGSVVEDPQQVAEFCRAFAGVQVPKILVHGGGNLATDIATRLGIKTTMVDGRRITDAASLDVAVMVYAGFANKQLVARLQANGCNALGLSGTDTDIIRCHKRIHPTIDFGFVGDIDAVDTERLLLFLQAQLVPVVCAITHDGSGQLLNTNADTIAGTIAASFAKQKQPVRFAYLFEKAGVLDANGNVMSKIDSAVYANLKTAGVIHGGMIPKLDTAFAAHQSGVDVRIANVSEAKRLFATWDVGTQIV